MAAVRLRRVGNRGHLVDPGAVVAIDVVNAGVRVVLACGTGMVVYQPADGAPATAEDVAKVHHQLTLKTT